LTQSALRSRSSFVNALVYYSFGFPLGKSQTVTIPRTARFATILWFILVVALLPGALLVSLVGGQLFLVFLFADVTAQSAVRLFLFRLSSAVNPKGMLYGMWSRAWSVASLCLFSFVDVFLVWQTASGAYAALAVAVAVAILGIYATQTRKRKIGENGEEI